jgi:diacylglycerol O-acyltransferase / wax synthase
MQRMTPLDSWFLYIEDDADHMHIGSVCLFEGPMPDIESLRSAIAGKLEAVPRYRQRVTPVPLAAGRPVWTDDPHFHIDYHVRLTALPRPGGRAQLRTLMGRVMGAQLDRRRPLWETWFVEGVDGERWAMITKVHHCMVDGIAGTDLLAAVLDLEPLPVAPTATDWEPTPAPGRLRLLVDASGEAVRGSIRRVRSPLGGPPGPLARRTLGTAMSTVRGAAELVGLLRPMPPTSLTGPIGPHRRWVEARVELSDAKEVRSHLGGTVNDVVLAVIAAGYRRLLLSRGELRPDVEVRTLVPVSLREEGQRGEYHNLVSALFAHLPVGVEDPTARYLRVRDELRLLKRSGEREAVAGLVGLTGIIPPALVGATMRTVTRLVQQHGQRLVSTVTTNVPGPQVPLYLLGRRMVDAYPYVPIGEGLRTGVAILSYDGALGFGVTGDYDTAADIEVLAEGIEAGMAELLQVVRSDAGGSGSAPGTGRAPGAGRAPGTGSAPVLEPAG